MGCSVPGVLEHRCSAHARSHAHRHNTIPSEKEKTDQVQIIWGKNKYNKSELPAASPRDSNSAAGPGAPEALQGADCRARGHPLLCCFLGSSRAPEDSPWAPASAAGAGSSRQKNCFNSGGLREKSCLSSFPGLPFRRLCYVDVEVNLDSQMICSRIFCGKTELKAGFQSKSLPSSLRWFNVWHLRASHHHYPPLWARTRLTVWCKPSLIADLLLQHCLVTAPT